jgi:hypothetical protein
MTPQQAVQRAEQIGAETRYRNQLARQMYQAGRHDAEADTARRGHRPPARSRMASPTPGWRSRGGPGGRVRLARPAAPATSPAGAPPQAGPETGKEAA